MNGAEALVRTLVDGGLDTCFANPGTSEMHLVAALDRVPGLRCILGLAEGVVTGAADGYARIAGRPAATLLHLGPGLGNGLANLHNAKKAGSPVLNIVGDHATVHRGFDAPLTADVEGFAAPVSHWVRTSMRGADLGRDTAAALAAARDGTGRIATLIVPADVAWSDDGQPEAPAPPVRMAETIDATAIAQAAGLLDKGDSAVLFIDGPALREPALSVAARIAAKTGARLVGPTFMAHAESGAGRPAVRRIPYRVDEALALLRDTLQAVLCGGGVPVHFFAYPGKPSLPLPPDCETLSIAGRHDDVLGALLHLEAALGTQSAEPRLRERATAGPATGPLTLAALGQSLAALLPDEAIVVEEAVSSSFVLLPLLEGAAPHTLLQLTGGAIGIALPLATGAAIAAPDAKVVCLEADGSGLYNLQALWTQARERTNVVTIILANRSYATLHGELVATGANAAGPQAAALFDLGNPTIDWVKLAAGFGVAGHRVETAEAFNQAFQQAVAQRGPVLIEAVLTPTVGGR